jgi:hypothetical protein
MLKQVGYRLYQDLLMPSRLGTYDRLLRRIAARGYSFLRIVDMAEWARSGRGPEMACVLRMDVDSDVPTAQRMFEIASANGIRGTYYFRKSTFNAALMRRIEAQGSEVGYHYEELSTLARLLGLGGKADIDAHLLEIQECFAKNLLEFANILGHPPKTIASHGDFVNRKLGLANHYAIDMSMRERFGIVAEAYDEWLNVHVRVRCSDRGPPMWWKPVTPDEAIDRLVPCIHLVVHPRQWHANIRENLRLGAERTYQEALWRVRGAVRAYRSLVSPLPRPGERAVAPAQIERQGAGEGSRKPEGGSLGLSLVRSVPPAFGADTGNLRSGDGVE